MSDAASKLKGLYWVLAATAVGVVLALGISPLVRAIPWKVEKKMASFLIGAPLSKICDGNARASAVLGTLKGRLYPLSPADSDFSIHVKIVQGPEVNAFAELGGEISVYEGLLSDAKSAEELAGVLAHEIEHVKQRHILEGALLRLVSAEGFKYIFSAGGFSTDSSWASFFLNLGFSRAQEAAADRGGLERLQQAHIDNHGYRDFFDRLAKKTSAPALLSDHPSDQDRLQMTEKFSNAGTRPIVTVPEWELLRKICRPQI